MIEGIETEYGGELELFQVLISHRGSLGSGDVWHEKPLITQDFKITFPLGPFLKEKAEILMKQFIV